jgi:PAS domain S-box-containing protein
VSVTTFVAATLVTVTTLLLGVFGVIRYRIDRDQQWSRLRRVVASHAEELAVGLPLAVWNIDRAQIDKIIEGGAGTPFIHAVVVNAAGKTHAHARDAQGRFVESDGRFPTGGLLRVERPIIYSGQRIGTVQVFATPRLITAELRRSAISFASAIVMIDVLLVLCVYFILHRTVLRPVVEIERYAVAVSAGGAATGTPLAAGAAAELVSLRSSIETMVNLLDARYVELQEEAVRRFESEERFRTIFDSVNDAIVIYDGETGALLAVNARFCEMMGYTRDEAIRFHMGEFVLGRTREEAQAANARYRALRDGEHLLAEWQVQRKNGGTLTVEAGIRAADIAGARRLIVVGRDVTARKEMEEQLRHSETMSAMGALVAGVAHEVRNPLFGIAATVDAFDAEFGGGEGAAEYMTTLRNDVARLTRLMHDLLEYGRPQKLAPHPQPIEPVIAEAVRVCSPRARERNIEIKPRIEGRLPYIDIDADRMLQVLKNVVENAIEFSSAGHSVSIGARAERNASATLVLTVADHGPGFRAEDLPHLFKPFFTRRGGGSGLGLAIAQKIVADHGGTIEATNAVAGGGNIEIRLPIAGAAAGT